MNRFELADAMLKGINTPGIIESREHYINPERGDYANFCEVCGDGAALVGHYNGDYKAAQDAFERLRHEMGEYETFAFLLDIDPALAVEIEHRHLNGMSIKQIAAWLKSGEETEVKFNV